MRCLFCSLQKNNYSWIQVILRQNFSVGLSLLHCKTNQIGVLRKDFVALEEYTIQNPWFNDTNPPSGWWSIARGVMRAIHEGCNAITLEGFSQLPLDPTDFELLPRFRLNISRALIRWKSRTRERNFTITTGKKLLFTRARRIGFKLIYLTCFVYLPYRCTCALSHFINWRVPVKDSHVSYYPLFHITPNILSTIFLSVDKLL